MWWTEKNREREQRGKKSREHLNLCSYKISLFPQTTTKRQQGQKQKPWFQNQSNDAGAIFSSPLSRVAPLAVADPLTMAAGTRDVAGASRVNFSTFLAGWTQLVSAVQFWVGPTLQGKKTSPAEHWKQEHLPPVLAGLFTNFVCTLSSHQGKQRKFISAGELMYISILWHKTS